jgi:hypothetical protein
MKVEVNTETAYTLTLSSEEAEALRSLLKVLDTDCEVRGNELLRRNLIEALSPRRWHSTHDEPRL